MGKEDAWLPRGKEKCWVGVAYFMGDPRVIERRLLKRGNWARIPSGSLGQARSFLGCGDLLGRAYLSQMNVHCESLRELGAKFPFCIFS